MANTKWSILNRMQLGRYAEYFAKMEFASYGLDVYTSEVDDHGIDFIVKDKKNIFNEIQVKSLRDKGYTFMKQENYDLNSKTLYLALLIFEEDSMPSIYLVPTSAWNNENNMFVIRNYTEEQKSKPEYGVNITNSNRHILENYRFEVMVKELM
ncbi:MAG: DUF4365 domain-containing protein [Bacilli bacterium]